MIHKNLISCRTCGFIHWHPLPDASTVARYYEDDQFYETHSPPDWFKKEEWEHHNWLWDSYYTYLESLLGNDRRVVDIGCGTGRFIHHLACKGKYEAYGVELSQVAWQWSPIKKRIYRTPGTLAQDTGNSWGNIVLILTLEHILDPEKWLREEALPHLDGRLIVVVPNEKNFLQKVLKTDHWVNKVHLNYFQPHTLKAMLERLNLRVVHTSATFPMEAFAFIGRNHIGNDEVGRKNHLLRLKFEKALGVRAFRFYSLLFKLFGVGREIIMVAERDNVPMG